jgi:hypothetical protein
VCEGVCVCERGRGGVRECVGVRGCVGVCICMQRLTAPADADATLKETFNTINQ